MNTETEIEMKDIEGYEGEYAVTRDGRVYSYKSKKFLAPAKNHSGYLKVDLCKNGKPTTCRVHRLVAEAFIPNPENKETVDHINRDRTNNNVENLRWATCKEQTANRDQEVAKRQLKEAQKKSAEKARKKTAMLDIETGKIIQVFASASEAARALGNVNKSGHIADVCRGKRKTAYGYRWAYVD